MKKIGLYFLLLLSIFILYGCSDKREADNKEEDGVEQANPAADFRYVKAIDVYGEDYAAEAVKKGEITTVNAIIIQKYIGTSNDVVIPKKIDDCPVEIIDNYAFSPYDAGLERDDEFWKDELQSAGLPLAGNGTATLEQGNFGSPYMKAFIDAVVSTSYQDFVAGEGKYTPAKHYIYDDESFNKVISYMKVRPKASHIERVVLHDNIRAIGGGAFMFCDSLKEVVFGNSRVVCNDFAFAFCTALEEVNAALTADVDGCFLACINLKNATTKGHHIGAYMFAGCINLEYLSVARQTKYAKEYALYRCPKLKTCNFPISFKLSPKFLDFTTFTARLSKNDSSYDEFVQKGYPFNYR